MPTPPCDASAARQHPFPRQAGEERAALCLSCAPVGPCLNGPRWCWGCPALAFGLPRDTLDDGAPGRGGPPPGHRGTEVVLPATVAGRSVDNDARFCARSPYFPNRKKSAGLSSPYQPPDCHQGIPTPAPYFFRLTSSALLQVPQFQFGDTLFLACSPVDRRSPKEAQPCKVTP
ncbi:hypothetical protein NDU88_009294 [Pleurodeles waltl]|uniref:Uncharacterized protein n=1 Tax=Pleurodeles waltl TaxID=8319 RepID=A0AAV7RUU2_PLEWA|nr:hypothetical protein NDU88_009294 [Pleurodeles waltl]